MWYDPLSPKWKENYLSTHLSTATNIFNFCQVQSYFYSFLSLLQIKKTFWWCKAKWQPYMDSVKTSKNQDMSTNVVMPYQNDSRLYFFIFENSMMDSLTTESTKKLFNQKWKPHLCLFINLHHSIFIYRYHFFVPRYFNIMLSLPRDF